MVGHVAALGHMRSSELVVTAVLSKMGGISGSILVGLSDFDRS